MIRSLDAFSMAYGLEARVPFLDHEFVELCSRIPSHQKMRWLEEKHILRRALKGVIPSDIVKRRKRGRGGLGGPFWPWRQALPPFVEDVLSECALRSAGLFDPRHVRRMLTQHQDGTRDWGRELLGVLHVQLWNGLFRQEPLITVDQGSRTMCGGVAKQTPVVI
jgi:asparagine synthase (glutamine-hydrolysing)